jgi:hypothetical protein
MRLNFLGQITLRDLEFTQSFTHAMVPTPVQLSNGNLKLFFTSLDENGRGRPFSCHLNPKNPFEITSYSEIPILELGDAGTFDDSGIVVTSVIQGLGDSLLMYYVGFERCTDSRYRMLTGIAVSEDSGLTFKKIGKAPILERTSDELYFRAGTFVLRDEDRFRMWYVGGSDWHAIDNKLFPTNNLKYLESNDGFKWTDKPNTQMIPNSDSELGFGRPWVIMRDNFNFEMFYSIRNRKNGKYAMGFARSDDGGESWRRYDTELGDNFDTKDGSEREYMYASVIKISGKFYMFYNGKNYGKEGIYVSELVN